MSVWEKTSYKLEIARYIYESLGDRIDDILGSKISPYMTPKGTLSTVDKYSTWEDVAGACNWANPVDDEVALYDFDRWTRKCKSWTVGTAAIYKIIYARSKNRFPVKAQYPYQLIENRLHAVATAVVPSTQVSTRAFLSHWIDCDERLLREGRSFEDLSEGWKFLLRKWDPTDIDFHVFEMDKFFGDEYQYYQIASYRGLIILRGRDLYTDQGLILTRTHVSFLIDASLRIANLVDYTAREHANNKILRVAIISMLKLTIEKAGKARKNNADKAVQAFHKARSFTQMILFDNIEEDARDAAVLEFKTKGLSDIFDLNDYLKIFMLLPRGMWLDVIHVYKWMPPPDYDATVAFHELRTYHYSTRKSGLDDCATERQKTLWKLVVRERKLNIAFAYRKSFDKWPTGLVIDDDCPTPEGLDSWEPKALFTYYTYGTDIVSQVKDKSTVLPDMHDEIYMKQNHPDKNFLLWFLRHYGQVDTRIEAQKLLTGGLAEDNYARVAYKGEAHKPGSRLFFMAPPIQRILLGELEGNISTIASVYPASLQGTTATVKDVRLHALFDIKMPDDLEGYEGDYSCFVVTFDLAKFSPRFNPLVLKDLHAFWADVFAYPPIKAMAAIGAQGQILHTTNKLVMRYENQGADLEGFRGRMMTCFHADLISAACRYATEEGYIVGRAFSAVFIDDGAVRVFAKGEGEEAYDNASKFLECLQDVYDAAGQENHPNKTIVSFIGGELLSEQFVYGQKLKCPIKAAMRLYPKYENPAATIVDEFNALFSTAQGSCKEGATWAVAYRRLAEAYLKSIFRWARNEFSRLDHVRFALKLITPKSAGGFGFPPMQAICSTTALDLTCEGFGMLNKCGKAIASYRPLVEYIMDRPILIREPLSILRDPLRIRFTGPIIIEGRLVNAIVRKLTQKEGPWSSFLKAYTAEDVHEHAREVAEGLLSREVFSAPVCRRVWEATPLAYLENVVMKFKKSDSISYVLHEKSISKIRYANKRDVVALVRYFF